MASSLRTMNPEEAVPQPESEDKDATNEVSSDEDGKVSGNKRSHPASDDGLDDTDDKKAERRAANRRSAFQSRQRRKILIEDLQRTVSALSKDNGDLRKTNDDLRVQLEATLLENHQFRMQQQLAGAANNPSFLGAQSLHSAQAQALLRGGGQAALSHLVTGAGAAGLGNNLGGSPPASVGSADPLLNARLALAASQSRTSDKLNLSQGSASGSTQSSAGGNKESSNGIQGILNAASLSNASGVAGLHGLLQNPGLNTQLAGLQAMLDHSAAGGGQIGGLQGLVEQLRGGGAASGLSDIQRALLRGSAVQSHNQNTVSDALRALLQKKG